VCVCVNITLQYYCPAILYVVNLETSIDGCCYISSAHPCEWILCTGVSCHLMPARETPAFNLMMSPAICWRFLKLQLGSVTFRYDEMTMLKYSVLSYFAQLAKVFSRGNYYVGGPRKVQICRNCLLTNTLIMRFCLFIVVNNCCLSRTINGTCAPICLFTVTVSTRECSLLLHSPNPIPLYVLKWSYWSKFKFRIPHWPNLNF
jgi:hypothetical protein